MARDHGNSTLRAHCSSAGSPEAARMGTCEVPGTQAAVSVWVSLAVPRVESEAEKGELVAPYLLCGSGSGEGM